MLIIEHQIIKKEYPDIKGADEMYLRYDFLLGNVTFKSKDSSIILNWEWIPLFDFAICLVIISNELALNDTKLESLEFTESDALLLFERNHEALKITLSGTGESISTTYHEFVSKSKSFYNNINEIAINVSPGLKSNPHYAKLLASTFLLGSA